MAWNWLNQPELEVKFRNAKGPVTTTGPFLIRLTGYQNVTGNQ